MAEEKVRFELQQYYDILMSSNLKEKLKPFVRQFKKKNIPFIYETLVNTMQVLTGKHEIPLMKFNALMATKLFFDTAEYVPIVLIEIYLLPIVFEIASYRIQKRSEEGLTLYFTEKGGYDSTKEMKRLGFNFVLLAIEFIFMSAQVKPYRCLQNQELREDSTYAITVRRLQRGLPNIENYNFYIPSYVAQTRKKYLKRLTKFSSQEYTDFFLKLICDEINLNKRPQLEMRKLFMFMDAYINVPIMHICEEQLSNIETNFVNKKKYLTIIGDFMKYGDIYPLLIITRSSFLEEIFNKLQKIKGEIGLEAGETIYPEVEASRNDKKQFYTEFLKYIQIWAHCHPYDENGELTDPKKIFEILKGRKFVFPSNILKNKFKAQMDQNLKANQKRNQKLIKLLDQHSQQDSKRKLNSSFRDSKLSKQGLKINSYIEFEQLEQMVLNAKKKLDLINEKSTLPITINALQKFRSFWESNAEKNQIEADQSGDIEIVLQEGDLCVKIIQMVVPVYQLYSKGAISFEQYKDRVDLLMKKEAQDSVKQVSFQQGIPKSESVEKFDDCYQKSSLSQLQSNVKKSQISLKKNSKISQKVSLQQSGLKQNDFQLQNNSEVSNKKAQSNVSFREESNVSSQPLPRISQKQSPKSSSLLEQQSFRKKKTPTLREEPQAIIQKDSVLHEESLQESQSGLRRSGSISSNRSRSRNMRKLENQVSKLSNKSQSALSSASANYRDAIGKGKLNYQDYYNQSKESFISSQHSIQLQKKKPVLIKAEPLVQAKVYAQHPKPEINNQDYFGQMQDKQSKDKQSSLSIDASKMKQSSELSKQSSKLQSGNEYRVNNYTQSILSYQSKKQSKSQSKISVHGSKQKKVPNLSNFALLAKYEQDESAIAEPQFQPLLHSFHSQKSQLTKVGSFRQCFEVNNQIILAKEGKEKLLKFTKTGKIANFIENAYPRQTPRNSTIVDIISQRNAKRSIDSYRHLREKSRATETLSQRMKSLQSFNKNMRMKILVRNQESRQQMPNRQEGNKVALKSSRVNGSEPVSFYNDSQSQHSQTHLRSETGQAGVSCEMLNVSRMINPKIYSHYFPASKSDKLRKCMLKSKSLLLKNNQFQIGCVTNRTQKGLQVSLFLTPLADSIEDVRLSLMHDHNLKARLFVKAIDHIKADQQEYVSLQFQVENVPFVLPTLNLKFKSNRNYAHNQMLISIPVSFNKFATYHPLKQHQVFPHQDAISLQDFPYYPKLINSERIRQSLTNFELIGKENRVSYYGCEAYFKGKIFTLRFGVGDKGSMLLEGRNMSGDHKNTKFLQFLLVTFRQIFQCPKKDKTK